MISAAEKHPAIRIRLAEILAAGGRPLLQAQYRAWVSGDRPAVLLCGAAVRSFILILAGSWHIDKSQNGERVTMADGENLTIFRRMRIDSPGSSEPMGEFRVRFHTRMPAQINKWFSWLPIPLFGGLPGFREKTWLVNEVSGFSVGIYHWQTVEDADRYSRSPALKFMTGRSLPGTVSHWAGQASRNIAEPWPPRGMELRAPNPTAHED